jgi:endoglucanase
MNTSIDRSLEITRLLLSCPTAPFREQHVRAYIVQFCADRHIPVRIDSMGNVVAVYGKKYPDGGLAFCAHMDHPGFIIAGDSFGKTARAFFYGGVETRYFKGSRVRIFTQNGPVKGSVLNVKIDKEFRRKHVRLSINAPVYSGDIAMWDLPAFQVRQSRIYSRACDDLVGCAALLCLLDQLSRGRVKRKVTACFTVAEEPGLHGAKHLCLTDALPSETCIISIETSSVLPSAKMGDGVVIRVGDRCSIFDPAVTELLLDTPPHIQGGDKTFRYQRKLMDAGTCEATVFSRFGRPCGAVCIPLGNYHNRNVRTGRIGSEYVSAEDFQNMVKLFIALVKGKDSRRTCKTPRYKIRKGSLGERFYW